ncbi:MAG TPA: glycosyltransferase family 39 protein [Acidisarcina sp.]
MQTELDLKSTGSAGTGTSHPHRLERTAVSLLFLMLALAGLGQAAGKQFGYDELVTLRIASLPSFHDIYQFFASGKDTTGYLCAVVVHAARRLHGRPEITTRLAFELAYLLTCECIYRFIRARYAAGFALAGTAAFGIAYVFYFASEIRPYAFALLGAGVGVYCWQRANRTPRHRSLAIFGLFAGLSMAILFHFFAVFLVAPFALAQWVEERTARRRRPAIWLAILLYPASVLLLAPSLLASHRVYGGTFWSRPSYTNLMDIYIQYMDLPSKSLPAALAVLAIAIWMHRTGRLGRLEAFLVRERGGSSGYSSGEWTLVFGLAFFPVVAFFGSFALGAYRWSYVLPFHIGMALLVAGLLAEVTRRSTRAGWALGLGMCLLLLAQKKSLLMQGTRVLIHRPAAPYPAEANQGWYELVRSSPLPLISDGPDPLVRLEHYAPPDIGRRAIYLTSRERALRVPSSVTNELNMEYFNPALHYNVEDYDTFIRSHHDFLLLTKPAQLIHTWLFYTLLQQAKTDARIHIELAWGERPLDTTEQIYRVHVE